MNNMTLKSIRLVLILMSLYVGTTQAVTVVQMETTLGSIQLELYEDRAPETVANFVKYVEAGFYNNLIFHRVIDGMIIQGGGYDQDFKAKDTNPPIANEAHNALKNVRGAIAMARLYDPDSADSQFFINLVDNPDWDFRSKSVTGYGYCVFGKVSKGMDVVDAIGKVETGIVGDFSDVPLKPVVINSVTVISKGSVE